MRSLFFFSLLGILLHPSAVSARDYAIELVVFQRETPEQNESDKEAREQWDFTSRRIEEKRLKMEELAEKSDPIPFAEDVFRLAKIRRALVSSGYEILRSASWKQPPLVYQHAPLVPLGSIASNLRSGFVRVYRTSLIFADVDLQLSPRASVFPPFQPNGDNENLPTSSSAGIPTAIDNASDSFPTSADDRFASVARLHQPHYYISEKRRIKFNEIHYFDHPQFGMILGVWPVASADSTQSATE